MHIAARFTVAAVLAAVAAYGDEKGPPTASGSNEKIGITATLLAEKAAIAAELGSDLGGNFTVVRVQVTPKDGPLALSRDDFTLRSYKDGQKSGAFHPSQIAGRGALVVSSGGGTAIMRGNTGPVWGGGPGGPGGRPRQLPGQGGTAGMGSTSSEAKATMDEGGKAKEDPVLAVLKAKVLEEKEITAPASGLLYFSLEGKHKPKQLSLMYSGPAGRLILEFR
ncbi:MAG TPA: hypothetical protein VN428_01965 [Bryobacteraceae bacterium]|nr:hypothetical protein [Bryobacteraceae bacterium]